MPMAAELVGRGLGQGALHCQGVHGEGEGLAVLVQNAVTVGIGPASLRQELQALSGS